MGRGIAWAWLGLVAAAAIAFLVWLVLSTGARAASVVLLYIAGPVALIAWMLMEPVLALLRPPPTPPEPSQHGGRTLGELIADGTTEGRGPIRQIEPPTMLHWAMLFGGIVLVLVGAMGVLVTPSTRAWFEPRWTGAEAVWIFVALVGAALCRRGFARISPAPPDDAGRGR